MPRILQLIDLHADFESESIADLLRDGLGKEHRVDRRVLRDNAASTVGAIMQLRKSRDAYDVIHAFSTRALTVAAMLGGNIIYSPVRFPNAQDVRWLRAMMSYREIQVLCPTDTMRRAYVSRGIAIDRCHLIRPGVQFGRINKRRDDALRASLGFSKDDHVILACGESTQTARHNLGLWTTSILHELDPKFRFLIWGRGDAAQTVENVNKKGLRPQMMSNAEAMLGRKVGFEELMPAANTVLITAAGPVSTLPICIAMAAAMPIVSTISTTVCELLEDRHTAIMLNTDKPRVIAQKVIDLIEDNHLQWKLADMARTEAYEFFSQSRLLENYRAIFTQLVDGKPVELPEPTAGAGLKFHGRA